MENLKEQPAEAESEEKPAETPAPADNGVSEANEMEKKKLERFVIYWSEYLSSCLTN